MINSAAFIRAGDAVTLATFNSSNIPADSITTEVTFRQNNQDRSRNFGAYKAYPFLGTRVIRIEGDILGTSYTDYKDKRLAIMSIADPQPGISASVSSPYYLGLLSLDVDGTTMVTWVTLDGYPELPIDVGMGPTNGRYMIAFKSIDPYLYSSTIHTQINITKNTSYTPVNLGNGYCRNMTFRINGPQTIGAGDAAITVIMDQPATPDRATLTFSARMLTSDYIDVDVLNRRLLFFENATGLTTQFNNYTMSNWDEWYLHPTGYTLGGLSDAIFWNTTATDATPGKMQISWQDAYLI